MLCSNHFSRWKWESRPRTPLEKWKAVVEQRGEDECWLLRDQTGSMGYGNIRLGKRQVSPHRLAWELFVGPIPAGLWVLHHCDTPECSNPKHLWLGTASDNALDRERKGRGRGGRSRVRKL